jgi:hypothetical protein
VHCPIFLYDGSPSSLKHSRANHGDCTDECWAKKNPESQYRTPTDDEWKDWVDKVWQVAKTRKRADKFKSSIPSKFHDLLDNEMSTSEGSDEENGLDNDEKGSAGQIEEEPEVDDSDGDLSSLTSIATSEPNEVEMGKYLLQSSSMWHVP